MKGGAPGQRLGQAAGGPASGKRRRSVEWRSDVRNMRALRTREYLRQACLKCRLLRPSYATTDPSEDPRPAHGHRRAIGVDDFEERERLAWTHRGSRQLLTRGGDVGATSTEILK